MSTATIATKQVTAGELLDILADHGVRLTIGEDMTLRQWVPASTPADVVAALETHREALRCALIERHLQRWLGRPVTKDQKLAIQLCADELGFPIDWLRVELLKDE